MSEQSITQRYDETNSHSTKAVKNAAQVAGYIEVTAKDLPLTCPTPDMMLWNAHPKVVIPINHGGEARCPYCSTLYRFKGELPRAHH